MVPRSRSAAPDLGTKHRVLHEPSAWMRGAAAKRVRQINAAVTDAPAFALIVAPLGRSGPPGSREDRECDRCGRYVPEGDLLHLIAYQPTALILLCAGLCTSCAQKEDDQ